MSVVPRLWTSSGNKKTSRRTRGWRGGGPVALADDDHCLHELESATAGPAVGRPSHDPAYSASTTRLRKPWRQGADGCGDQLGPDAESATTSTTAAPSTRATTTRAAEDSPPRARVPRRPISRTRAEPGPHHSASTYAAPTTSTPPTRGTPKS